MKIFAIAAAAVLALAGFVTSADARTKALAMKDASHFAQELKSSGQFEIESSTLALKKSDNDAVKKFAQKMIDDHTAADKKLMETLKQAGLPAPKYAELGEQRDLLNGLTVVNGQAFDRKYVRDQLNAHKQAIELLQAYSKHGDNQDLRQLASNLLPTIEEHYRMAEQLRPEVTARR